MKYIGNSAEALTSEHMNSEKRPPYRNTGLVTLTQCSMTSNPRRLCPAGSRSGFRTDIWWRNQTKGKSGRCVAEKHFRVLDCKQHCYHVTTIGHRLYNARKKSFAEPSFRGKHPIESRTMLIWAGSHPLRLFNACILFFGQFVREVKCSVVAAKNTSAQRHQYISPGFRN